MSYKLVKIIVLSSYIAAIISVIVGWFLNQLIFLLIFILLALFAFIFERIFGRCKNCNKRISVLRSKCEKCPYCNAPLDSETEKYDDESEDDKN